MYKHSSGLGSKTESRVNGVPNVQLGRNEETEPSSAAVLWRQDLPSISNGIPPGHMRADLLERDGYQVALIAPGRRVDHRDSSLPPAIASAQVFLLPLTWKDLAVLMRADLRHSNSVEANNVVRFGHVGVDFGGMTVTRSGKPVALTSMEFKTLKFLVQRPGQVVSRDELLDEVWGYDNYPCTRTVDNHILRLRQKLESDPGRPVHFLTVHSAGYKFVP
jgi:DNA-binding winged helix-turn-helix (wHTH) protein